MRRALLFSSIILAASTANASEFCDGFAAGFKSVKGDYALVPICPLEPFHSYGTDPFDAGASLGVKKAGDGVTFDPSTNNRYVTTTDNRGNTTVRGSNSLNGSTWTQRIMANGNQSGTDAEGRYWQYYIRSKTYTRSDGKTCTGVGTSYEYCTGGR